MKNSGGKEKYEIDQKFVPVFLQHVGARIPSESLAIGQTLFK